MTAQNLEQFAAALGQFATTGDNSHFLKLAQETGLFRIKKADAPASSGISDYLKNIDPRILWSLGGMGAGGLVGLLQGKNKKRNALWYGLMGGLAGLGGRVGYDYLNSPAPGSTDAVSADGKKLTPKQLYAMTGAEAKKLPAEAQLTRANLPATAEQLAAGATAAGAAGYGTSRAIHSPWVRDKLKRPLNLSELLDPAQKWPGGVISRYNQDESKAISELLRTGRRPSRINTGLFTGGNATAQQLSRMLNDPKIVGEAATAIPPSRLRSNMAAKRFPGVAGATFRFGLPALSAALAGRAAVNNTPNRYQAGRALSDYADSFNLGPLPSVNLPK